MDGNQIVLGDRIYRSVFDPILISILVWKHEDDDDGDDDDDDRVNGGWARVRSNTAQTPNENRFKIELLRPLAPSVPSLFVYIYMCV